ncbi:HNH endonuclease signature motif containing protein [Nocardioides sp.]|uniref:HNH endonuclease signature motif containing protein n=1 Tax=Nocardioides sp. TaxID=35761 RepID=UPI00261D7EC2|nr:HNH endonuclease signature motif containing protein [Nocardioides sp.]
MKSSGSDVATSSAEALLEGWRVDQVKARRREVKALDKAIGWLRLVADTEPAEKRYGLEMPVGGDGCPRIGEEAVAEFAAFAQMSPRAALSYLADVWDLAWRFPETLAAVRDGRVEVWRARQVAATLRSVPAEGARYVDEVIAPIAHRVGMARLRRMVVVAEILSDPDAAVARARAAAEGRSISVSGTGQPDGLADVFGRLDAADAADFEAAIQEVAAQLAESDGDGRDGCGGGREPESLDVRRAKAVGVIARRQLAGSAEETPDAVTRVVHTYVHLTRDSSIAQVEAGNTLAPVERVAEWCRTAGTKVIIRPVLDLAAPHTRDGYVPSETMREQAILINRTCVHPWCEHPARACDLDHITPYNPSGPPGQTSSTNLAPLCRHHHRLKTHSGWQYQHLEPGVFLWTTPAGRQYLRTPTGTTALSAQPRAA